MRPVPHEITMFAYHRDPDTGDRAVFDAVWTSNHFASHFARRWMRDPQVTAIGAFAPGPIGVTYDRTQIREIRA